MDINQNVSIWRGSNTPPTQYHLWLKEDKLYHTNVKVLTDRDTYENIEEYYGSLSFIKDKDGNKYAVGSTGVVATTFNIDSESQSSLSKEYLDRRAHIRKLEEQIETYKKSPNLSIDDLSVIDDLNAQLQKEIAITNSMKSYSAGMKIKSLIWIYCFYENVKRYYFLSFLTGFSLKWRIG